MRTQIGAAPLTVCVICMECRALLEAYVARNRVLACLTQAYQTLLTSGASGELDVMGLLLTETRDLVRSARAAYQTHRRIGHGE